MLTCAICGIDPAVEKHHVLPKSKGGRKLETVDCCSDCGGQVHMLFSNKDLALMSLGELVSQEKMQTYIKWKKKHPGEHRHRMSSEVKKWKAGHR
jgi:hypothetical protein